MEEHFSGNQLRPVRLRFLLRSEAVHLDFHVLDTAPRGLSRLRAWFGEIPRDGLTIAWCSANAYTRRQQS